MPGTGKHKGPLNFPENYNVKNHYGEPHMSHPDMYEPKDGHSPEDGHTMPASAGLKKLAEANPDKLKYIGPEVSGGGPKMVGSKEKYTSGNFAENHHMKMMGSPLYYGPESNVVGFAKTVADFTASDKNKEVFKDKEDKEEKQEKSSASSNLSAARKRRRDARRNLKADRLNRRASRMEERRR